MIRFHVRAACFICKHWHVAYKSLTEAKRTAHQPNQMPIPLVSKGKIQSIAFLKCYETTHPVLKSPCLLQHLAFKEELLPSQLVQCRVLPNLPQAC
eukprot:1158483-Pelagomonas_calceolata.AAC.12